MDYLKIKELYHSKSKSKNNSEKNSDCDWDLNKHDGQPCPHHSSSSTDEDNKKVLNDLFKMEQKLNKLEKQEMENSKKILDKTSEELKEISKFIPKKPGIYTHPDYSQKTNQEMENTIKRLDLEQRYAQAKGEQKYIKTGSEKVKEALSNIAGLVSLVGGGIAIVNAVKDLKGTRSAKANTKQNN